MDKFEILKQYFGYSEFRQGQEAIINNILNGKDVISIMPTGAGKSICYQIPALMMQGVALVISPLISLMKDQVDALVQSGIKAAYLNSSLSAGQYSEVLNRAANGEYQIIYAAPERLMTEDFLSLTKQIKISMISVDEAHCISQWGQDFRPSYLKIVEFVEQLPNRPVISAFTATATLEVREDIIGILRLQDPFAIATGFDRKNLFFGVEKPGNKFSALLKIIKKHENKSGIIYCSTRKAVETVFHKLVESGYPATYYHAGLDTKERQKNQEDFLYDRKPLMVATNAFGMGIDKSNVSFVVHYNMPQNIESYYQEAGRAGRDGEPADCILLYSGQDVRTNRFLIENSENMNADFTEEMRLAVKQKDLERLKFMTYYCNADDCLREYILKYFGESAANYCGNCSNCMTAFETVDVTLEAQKILSCVFRIAQRNKSFGKMMILDILFGKKNERIVSLGLDSLSTFGILSDTTIHKARRILDYLVQNEYLSASDDEYPVLGLTERSREILYDKHKIEMKFPRETAPDRRKVTLPPGSEGLDKELFSLLRNLRAQYAANAHVPAYVIFTDATLREMCQRLPRTPEELLEISGVGNAKLKRYGDAFLEVIKEYAK